MDITFLTHAEIGKIAAVLVRIGITREDIGLIFDMCSMSVDTRLKEAGYLRLANIPGWHRGISRKLDLVVISANTYLENFDENAQNDQLSDAQKEVLRLALLTWLDHNENLNPYEGYQSKCVRQAVVRRLYRLGIHKAAIPRITGYNYQVVRLDLKGYEPEERDESRAYANAFCDYAESVAKAAIGAFVEEGIGNAKWYGEVLERYLQKSEIFAFAHGTLIATHALTTPSFTPAQEPYVRLYLAMIGEPKLLNRRQSPKEILRNITFRFERYIMGIASETTPPPKDKWEIIRMLTLGSNERDDIWPAWKQEWCDALDAFMTELSDRDRYIIRKLYGFEGSPVGTEKIAKNMGFSRAYIDRLSHEASDQMKKNDVFKLLACEAVPLGKIGEAQSSLQKELGEALTMIEWLKQKPVVVSGMDVVEEDEEVLNEHLFRRVDELELSVRAANCLENAGIEYIYQLVERSESEMLKTKNFGRKSLNEINEILSELGLQLGMKLNEEKLAKHHPRRHPPDPDVLTDTNPYLLKPVEELGLYESTCLILHGYGIFYIYELIERDGGNLWSMTCLNNREVYQIRNALEQIQLVTGMKIQRKPPQERTTTNQP